MQKEDNSMGENVSFRHFDVGDFPSDSHFTFPIFFFIIIFTIISICTKDYGFTVSCIKG
jgi:hypothetical protein